MTTAYLQDTAINRIDHEYGALRLESKHSAPRYLPLRLLTRIVAKGAIDWSAHAIAACLSNNIPVALLGSNGSTLGHLSPASPNNTILENLSNSLHHLPMEADFTAWHRSRERLSMIKNLNNKRWSLNDLRTESVWSQECEDHQRLRPTFNVEHIDTLMVHLLEVWLHHELCSRGVVSALIRDDTYPKGINLLAALKDSLIWILRSRYGQWHHKAQSSFCTEIAFENMQSHLNILLRKELDNLQKWIQEVYHEHGG